MKNGFKFYALAGWTEENLPIGGYLKYFHHAPQKAVSGRIIGRDISINFSGNFLEEGILDAEFKQKGKEPIMDKLKINKNHYVGKSFEFDLFEINNFPDTLLPI